MTTDTSRPPGANWLITVLFLIAFSSTLNAQFQVVTNNGAITIVGYTGPGGQVVVIPDTIGDFPVTAIGDNAFYDRFHFGTLRSITIPNNVTSIGTNAFGNCSALTNVTFGPGLSSLGDHAFEDCWSLASVILPERVTNIGRYAFSYSGLTNVSIPNSVTTIQEGAFNGCRGLSRVMIPNGVSAIPSYAFSECSGLTNVSIPNSVITIGDSAFYDCSSLTEVALGSAVAAIGEQAFGECSLSSVTIPASVNSIGDCAFCCDSLTNITVDTANPSFVSLDGVLINKTLGRLTCWPKGKAGSYAVPSGVTSIGDSAFGGCSRLTDVTISIGVTNIGDGAFIWCDSLTNVTIPSSVTTIGDQAFEWCAALGSVVLPDGVTTIGNYAFWGCGSLAKFTIPSSVTTIGSGAFCNCALTSLTIPSSVSAIGDFAFCPSALTNLTVDTANPFFASSDSVLFNKTLTTLIYCPSSKVGNYTVPSTVTNIGVGAFDACFGLANFFIPKGVTSIGDYAFAEFGGQGYPRIFFQGNAPAFGSDPFYGTQATGYYLPGATGWPVSNPDGSFYTCLWEVRPPRPRFITNCFVFTLTGTAGVPISIEVSTNPATGPWQLLQTCTLDPCAPNNGAIDLSDPVPTNASARFYRFRSP